MADGPAMANANARMTSRMKIWLLPSVTTSVVFMIMNTAAAALPVVAVAAAASTTAVVVGCGGGGVSTIFDDDGNNFDNDVRHTHSKSGIEDPSGSIIKNNDNDDDSITINSNDFQNHQTPPHHLHLLDRHVASSPLSVAAVCRDGIALISLHYDVDVILSTSSSSSSLSPPSSSKSFPSTLDPNKICRLTQQSDDNDNIAGGDEDGCEVKTVLGVTDDATTTITIASNNLINTDKNNNKSEGSKPRHAILFVDLPLSFRGPLRIETIYENSNHHNGNHHQHSTQHSLSSIRLSPPPMSLLTAGWRADSITLANAGRELMAQEVRVYSLPTLSSLASTPTTTSTFTSDQMTPIIVDKEQLIEEREGGDGSVLEAEHKQNPRRRGPTTTQPTYHGRRIAEGLSYYLTKCAATESGGIGGGSSADAAIASRPLSCVGMLACGGGRSGSGGGGGGGSLHLIDSTGAYRVRAHAIGDAIRASKLHQRMMHVDFSTMECNDGLRVLLRLIAELEEEKGGSTIQEEERTSTIENAEVMLEVNDQNEVEASPITQQLRLESPHYRGKNSPSQYKAAVELAVLRSGEGRMRRVRLSSLI